MGVLARELLVGKSAALPEGALVFSRTSTAGAAELEVPRSEGTGCPYWEESPALRAPQYKDVKTEWDT